MKLVLKNYLLSKLNNQEKNVGFLEDGCCY